ncbi:MAG TPA: hypothetical protein VMW16_04420 [Sedimentisphaerales bacterium]|nr:hypothetical protein [Sedimentisphaerales bacterium]
MFSKAAVVDALATGDATIISFAFLFLHSKTPPRIVEPIAIPSPTSMTTLSAISGSDCPRPQHVQQPLIQTVVDELRQRGKCPSTGVTAARTNWIMGEIIANRK